MPNQLPQSPGDYIRQLLEGRCWSQVDLATVLNVPPSRVSELIQNKKVIDPELAINLSEAFIGTSPKEWLELDGSYRLALVGAGDGTVRKRASLLEVAPIREMEKRGWIKKTSCAIELEDELKKFFGASDLSNPRTFPLSTRRADDEDAADLTPAQWAWCFRARTLAADIMVGPYDPGRLAECERELQRLSAFAPEAAKVANTLADYGIRFVVVEPLPGSKIDGAAFWIGDSPVIAVSLRFDRIDAFWFTLCHELSHIRHEDSLSVDTDLAGEDVEFAAAKSPIERRADNEAAEMLIPPDKIKSFIQRVAPLYSKTRIIQFAHRIKVHPGIIVGQLQHRGEIGFHANRDLLVKVREIVASASLTDGWGHSVA